LKLLVFGAGGIVGRALVAEGTRRGWSVTGLPRAAADVTDRAAVHAALAGCRPDLVVNCAAFTRVDACESERETALRINGEAPGGIAAECARAGARFVQPSSDYVFDGEATEPYREEDATGPRSVYGESKLEGERRTLAAGGRSLIVRTSWVFGHGGSHFVAAIRSRIEAGGGPLRVVADQTGGPTYAPFLARAIADLGESGTSGIVHYQNREPVTWYEFAREIARQLGRRVEIRPVTTEEYPLPARRPRFSVLAVARFERLVGRPVESWRTGLAEYLAGEPAQESGEKR
jgi:dTDP-4-dehydrorhamnose reductase